MIYNIIQHNTFDIVAAKAKAKLNSQLISWLFSLALPTKRCDLEVFMCGIYTKKH